jgi:hypothetical protein
MGEAPHDLWSEIWIAAGNRPMRAILPAPDLAAARQLLVCNGMESSERSVVALRKVDVLRS